MAPGGCEKLRNFICEDYYMLLPPPKSLNDNEGWEFIDPLTKEGFIQLFRTQSNNGNITVYIRDIDENSIYILSDPYTNEKNEYTGKELANGIEFYLNPFTSLVRIFTKK